VDLTGTILEQIWGTALSVVIAIAPLTVLFVLFQFFLLRLPARQVREILLGTAFAALGLFLFLLGVGIGFLPFGRAIGLAIGAIDNPLLLIAIGLFLGFVTTWGEPAIRILADQVNEASHGGIPGRLVLWSICCGVAIWVTLGLLRIAFGVPILYLLVPSYFLAVMLLWKGDRDFVAIAIDASGVATGPLANTFLLALALGAAAAIGEDDPLGQGFGMVALIAVAPIVAVSILGLLIRRRDTKER